MDSAEMSDADAPLVFEPVATAHGGALECVARVERLGRRLSAELWVRVLSFLDPPALARTSSVARGLRWLPSDNTIWKPLT